MAYDTIHKLSISASPAEAARMFLGWNATHVEPVSVEVPAATTRRVDNLFRVTLEHRPLPILLHIEWFTYNDPELPLRNLRYFTDIKLHHDPHDLYEVVQLVLYSGHKPLAMPSDYHSKNVSYAYTLIDLQTIPYRDFLATGTPELMILAILGRLDDTEASIRDILQTLANALHQRRDELHTIWQHLRILSRLRPKALNYVEHYMEAMKLYIHIDKEDDPYYREGIRKGEFEGKLEGMLEGKLETARQLFRKGLSFELIQDVTGLDAHTLRTVQNDAE
jgi:predicted transposase/invertase (TIGR01784 family)